MAGLLKPDAQLCRQIELASRSTTNMCWTCGSCDFECPVNIATGRLRPQKVVRLAKLGLLDALLHLPEIWYCLTCRRCMQICPNAVSPSTLIEFIRREALNRGIVSIDAVRLYHDLFARFQRVRWRAVNHCFNEDLDVFTDQMWHEWLRQPVSCSTSIITQHQQTCLTSDVRAMMASSRTSACFTCGECDSACPIFGGRSVFDPRALFRMINFGMVDELMRSPSLWLCIACGRCTESCSQLVDGRQIIEQVKALAIRTGVIDIDFHLRVEHANQLIYKRFLKEIDLLFGASH